MQAKRNKRKIWGRGKRKGGKRYRRKGKREKNIKRRGKRRVMEEKNKQGEGYWINKGSSDISSDTAIM